LSFVVIDGRLFKLKQNILQLQTGPDLTNEISAKRCTSIYYFPANQAPKHCLQITFSYTRI